MRDLEPQLSLREAAPYFGHSVEWLQDECRERLRPYCRRIGGKWFMTESQIRAALIALDDTPATDAADTGVFEPPTRSRPRRKTA